MQYIEVSVVLNTPKTSTEHTMDEMMEYLQLWIPNFQKSNQICVSVFVLRRKPEFHVPFFAIVPNLFVFLRRLDELNFFNNDCKLSTCPNFENRLIKIRKLLLKKQKISMNFLFGIRINKIPR